MLALLAPVPATAAMGTDPPHDPAYPATIEELTLLSAGQRMPGLIYIAAGAGPHPTVLLLHGFPGNEKNLDIAQALRRSGFNVLFFHYRGAWGAEGAYRTSSQHEDVAAVLAYLRDPANAGRLRVDSTRLSLLGHSLGGFTALAAGSRDAGLACVGAMAPANLGVWKAGLAAGDANADRLLAYADSLFMLADFDAEVMKAELASTSMADLDSTGFGPGLRGKSVFLVVGEQDDVTPATIMFEPVVKAYMKEDALRLEHHIIPGDHSFSSSRLRLSALIEDWMKRDCR
jgi:pimeloyl-ACP methyl ester carboxylesterase